MSGTLAAAEQRVIIDRVRWSTYLALLEDGEHRRGRMTYDRGVLEIMSPSKSHEQTGCLIGRMIEAFTEELQIDILSVASTTVKLERIQRGFEADEAYYIQRAAEVRGKEELDWAVDPAPDLVVEVDISRTSIPKLPIYASFQIPEVWQFRGDRLHILLLSTNDYVESQFSRVLSGFPFEQLHVLLSQRNKTSETELIRGFRARVREHLVR